MARTSTVLVIDDEPDARLMLRTAITAAGGSLRWAGEAANAFEGMSQWRMLQPDVIVLDQRLPEIDGLTVARAIHNRDPDQPIILCCASVTPALLRRAREVGIRACVPKTEMHRLREALHAAVVPT